MARARDPRRAPALLWLALAAAIGACASETKATCARDSECLPSEGCSDAGLCEALDAGMRDGGAKDGGARDAGQADSGSSDAGKADAGGNKG